MRQACFLHRTVLSLSWQWPLAKSFDEKGVRTGQSRGSIATSRNFRLPAGRQRWLPVICLGRMRTTMPRQNR